jgi:nucleoside-diphosphate-sugar epimerase
LADKTILVTGASGFIGGNLCRRLASNGAEVHAVARAAWDDVPAGVRAWHVDLGDGDRVRRLVREVKPAVVFHLAGYVLGSRGLDHVALALAGNLTTAVNVLVAVAEAGCERLVMTGSQEEPDPGEACATAFVPSSPYAAAKFAGSAYARMFGALYDCPVAIGRIFMGYGPGQRDLKKLVPYAILSLLRGEAPRMGTGARLLDWIYVDDIVDGLLLVSTSPEAVGCAVDLGTGVAHTAREAVETLAGIMGSTVAPSFGDVPDRQLEQVRVANVEATKATLEWSPAVTLPEGLRRTVAWYRERTEAGALSLS